jgi:hypothetical protein
MKKALAVSCVRFLTLLVPSLLHAQAFSPTPEASKACQNVNPVVAWRECIEKYQQQEQALKADPKYQEELRLRDELRQQAEQQGRLLEEIIRQQQQRLDLLEQQQRIMQERKVPATRKGVR